MNFLNAISAAFNVAGPVLDMGISLVNFGRKLVDDANASAEEKLAAHAALNKRLALNVAEAKLEDEETQGIAEAIKAELEKVPEPKPTV